MCGYQFSFDYTGIQDVQGLHENVEDRIAEFYKDYNITDEDVVYVQISFRKVNIQLLAEFCLDDDSTEIDNFITKPVYKKLEGLSNVPVSVNEFYLGKSLLTESDSKGNIKYIHLIYKDNHINFLDIIRNKAVLLGINHVDHIISFDNLYKFYLLKDKKFDYVLAIKWLDDKTIDKIRYAMNGVILNHVTDKLINHDTVNRKSRNNEILIKSNQVIETRQLINLKPISIPKFDTKHVENPNIGTIDCETFIDLDDIHKVYSLGFRTNLDDKTITYYVNKDINAHDIVLELVNELLRPKYENIKFYCHNFGGFDVFFILKVLFDYNAKNKDNKYNINPIFRDDRILRCN